MNYTGFIADCSSVLLQGSQRFQCWVKKSVEKSQRPNLDLKRWRWKNLHRLKNEKWSAFRTSFQHLTGINDKTTWYQDWSDIYFVKTVIRISFFPVILYLLFFYFPVKNVVVMHYKIPVFYIFHFLQLLLKLICHWMTQYTYNLLI